MTIGAGLAPAGTSLAGYGVPTTVPTPGTVIYPDLTTGIMQSGRLLNPLTKDYTFTADGRIAGGATVPQLVQLALITEFGSSCLNLGIDFSSITVKGANYVQQVSTAVSLAVSSLVQQQLIEIISINVTSIPQDSGLAVLVYRDLTTNLQYNQYVQNP